MHPNIHHQIRARRHKPQGAALSTLIASSAFVASALAQPVAPDATTSTPPEGEAIQLMEFFVSERGVSRATNAITATDAKVALPGMSVEKLLNLVPGVNIRSTDPFGFYEFGNDIRVRSFGINALAVTIDDIPMGSNNPRYGTPAGRIVDGENLRTISVSQGTGDVTTPAYEALGGAIKYYTSDPSRTASALVKYSVGDFNMRRSFARFDTGELLPGLTAFVSTSQLTFNSAGVPSESEGRKVEGKIRYETPRANFMLAYTWNDRDDYDIRSIQWDRWRALETGDPYAGYGPGAVGTIYSASGDTNLLMLAANGYTDYLPSNMAERAAAAGLSPTASLAGFLNGDYSDGARSYGPVSYLGSAEVMGDGIYNQYYRLYRNGRMDSLVRGAADFTVNESIIVKGSSYYHDRSNYGTFPVLRSDARTQIRNSYIPANNTTGELREDIWPRYAYRDTAGNLVSFGTAGAIPVGYNDANGNGFFDPGETLNAGLATTEFSNGHALIAPTSTTLADATSGIPGAVGRDEDFGGFRYGLNLSGVWTTTRHKVTAGLWFEKDDQSAFRPTYNLEGGNPNGGFLYDQILFNNYDQRFITDSTMFYIEDVIRLMDERLTLTLGAKSLTVDKYAEGILFTQNYWRPLAQQRVVREITYEDNFLPQFGASYKLSNQVELFTSFAENLASPANNVIANVDFNTDLRPERAKNYDLGMRYSGRSFGSSLSLFYNQYEDRILSQALTQEELIARGLQGVTGATTFRNVGGIDSYGAEFSYDWRTPIDGLRVTGAVAYQISEFAENLIVPYSSMHVNANDPRSVFFEPIPNPNGGAPAFSYELQKGRSQGNTPELTVNFDLMYTRGLFDFNFGGQYYDGVYVNTLNTERVPSYTNFNAGVTARGAKGSRLEPFKLSATVQNLFDQTIWRANGYNGSFNGSVIPDYGRNLVMTVEASF
jgi:outer membrane receptor protein involved in Fe transport